MKYLITALFAATAIASPPAPKPGPPAIVTIETRDLKVEFAGERAWTMQRIFFKGTLLCDKNGFYGTVFAPQGGKWIGTGHTEGGIEQIEHVSLSVDGKSCELADKAVYRGNRAEWTKRSMIGPLKLEANYVVTDDCLIERHRYEAIDEVKAHTLYAFMHPWIPSTSEWIAEKPDGTIIEGKLDSSGGFQLKQDVKWTALYDPVSHKAALAWYPTPLAGQGIKTGYWNLKHYHKLYNQILNDITLPKGAKFEAAVIVRGVETDTDHWKETAKTVAADTHRRYDKGDIK